MTQPKRSNLATLEHGLALDTDECVIWPHGKNGKGYGETQYEGKHQKVHRIACAQAHGPAPSPTHQAAHSCDNRACFNPRHLRWATPAENSRDMTDRSRQARGSKINHAKLTADDVAEIRHLRALCFTLADIGERFGISESNVSLIVNRKTWC